MIIVIVFLNGSGKENCGRIIESPYMRAAAIPAAATGGTFRCMVGRT
jgi:hypothetical protein